MIAPAINNGGNFLVHTQQPRQFNVHGFTFPLSCPEDIQSTIPTAAREKTLVIQRPTTASDKLGMRVVDVQ